MSALDADTLADAGTLGIGLFSGPTGTTTGNMDSTWNGDSTPGVASGPDPLSIFNSAVNAGSNLVAAIGGGVAQVRNAATANYLSQANANILKAQADAAVAAAQRPMGVAGKYDSILLWCAIAGVIFAAFQFAGKK